MKNLGIWQFTRVAFKEQSKESGRSPNSVVKGFRVMTLICTFYKQAKWIHLMFDWFKHFVNHHAKSSFS